MVETRRSSRLPPRSAAESAKKRDSRQTRSSSKKESLELQQQKWPTRPEISAAADPASMKSSSTIKESVTGNAAAVGASLSHQHFLHGFQVEKCKDVLSIPDPPSPAKVSSRRLSSPIVTFPLREISANASDVEEDDLAAGASSKVTTRRKKKRTRNSLAHLHSPMEPSAAISATPAAKAEAVAPPFSNTLSTSTPALAAPQSMKESAQASSKRRKKRQSLVLPSDLESTEGTASQDEFTKTYASFKNKPSPPATPAKETKTPTKPSTSTLHDLRKLVHEYTNIPKDKRDNSAPAKEIMERTGYCPRSAPFTKGASNLPTEPSREQKINFFSKLGPDLQKMDACKVSDAKMVAEVTQCKPQKVRGGYYRYFHSETGRAVSPEEFEERYLLMLEEVNEIRSKSWANYFDKLREEDEDRRCSERSAIMTPKKEEEPEESTAMLDESNDAEKMEVDFEETQESKALSDTKKSEPNPSTPNSCMSDDSGMDDCDMLPLPSRDEESTDPLIAQAERKLFKTIDKALRVYSREVRAAQGVVAPPTPVHC